MKVFVTVGTQLPFDRLLILVDEWLSENKFSDPVNVVVQGLESSIEYKNFVCIPFMKPAEYEDNLKSSDLIVAHAGMGSIISAVENLKPIIIFPRKFEFGEHRNDHQSSTAKRYGVLEGVYVAKEKSELFSLLNNRNTLSPSAGKFQNGPLINYIRNWVVD